jgi:tetratricopeptide (TPR) repeat protein
MPMNTQGKMLELDDAASWAGATEEFLAQIHRSSDLLSQDRQDEARQLLETAFESRADDASGQATLALVYFKLGIYPRAAAIYRRLVEKYPEEPTLRLNLGLVYLKTGQTERAARELEKVVSLAPEYRKANGYLGLAYQRLGDYQGARKSYEKANIKHLAERMARFSEAGAPDGDVESAQCGNLNLSYAPDSRGVEDAVSASLAKFVDELPFLPSAPSPREADHRATEPIPVSELAQKARLPECLANRFLISEAGYLLMDVETRGYSRLAGLHFVSAEQLSYRPVKRKYRGRDCDEIFGDKENVLFEIEGSGRLGFHPSGKVFSAISLDGESAYIREELLFALDPELKFENGRIPGEGSMLVHVSGRGSLVLQTVSEPRSLEVTAKRGVVIPSADVVGWFGRLLPRAAKGSPFAPELNALEIVGEGILLVCLS